MSRLSFYARYALVGVLGGVIQTLSLYIWVDVAGLRDTYIYGVAIGFCVALATTFTLQKWWTFRDHSSHRTWRQFVMYTLIALGSVFLNSSLLHISKTLFDSSGLDFFRGWYLAAEALIVAIVAVVSFVANSFLSFEEGRRNTKVVIFGGSGLVGSELMRALKARGINVCVPRHRELDITDAKALKDFLKLHKPTHVVNLAANLNVNEIEKDPSSAKKLNVDAAVAIATIIAEENLRAHYLFMSTSYVFPDGGDSWAENDAPRPENEYGKTKALAEHLIQDVSRKGDVTCSIFRTSWIYGLARPTFVDEVARSLLAGESFVAAGDQKGNLVSARDIAIAIAAHIEKNAGGGIFHVFNEDGGGGLSRYQIAREIARALSISDEKVTEGSKQQIFTGGRRPSIVLINTKMAPLREFEEALHEYLEERYGRAQT